MLLNTNTNISFIPTEIAKSFALEVRDCPENTVILANSTTQEGSKYFEAMI